MARSRISQLLKGKILHRDNERLFEIWGARPIPYTAKVVVYGEGHFQVLALYALGMLCGGKEVSVNTYAPNTTKPKVERTYKYQLKIKES